MYVAIIPGSRIGFAVTPPGCRKFQYKPGSSFLQVDAAFRHVDIKRVFRGSRLKFHIDFTLLGKTVGICLRSTRHTDRLRFHPVPVNVHFGRRRGGIISHKVKFYLFVLPRFQARNKMILRKNTAVRKTYHRADERRRSSGFQDINIDTFRL